MTARDLVTFGVPARYAVIEDPLQVDVASQELRPVPDDATIADLVPGAEFVCAVIGPDYPDGAYIPRAHWHYAPAPGHVVIVHRPALGGGSKSASARMLLSVALMALLPNLAPFLKLQGFLTGVPSFLITAAGAVAGNALINALVPLDSTNFRGGTESPTYSVNAQGNQPRIDSVIPELFGRNATYADFACPPYSVFIEQDQYLHVVLMVGTGQYAIRKVANETTPLESYADVTVIRCGPGQSTLDGPGTGVESLTDQSLVELNIYTSPIVSGLELEYGRFSGPYPACPPERKVTAIGVDVVLPRGLDPDREIVWVVQVQPIDDFDQPLGPWVTVGSHTYTTDSVTPVRLSYEYAVAAARYHVGFRRMDQRSTSAGSAHDIQIAGLRGRLNEVGIDYEAGTYVVVRARATGQLNGSLRIRVTSDRMLPIWNPLSGWSAPQVTRNPAWAIARVLHARGLDDDQIDLEQLLGLALTWEGRFDRFDYAFDAVSTCWDALALIARVGRAVPLIRGSRYTFWRDQQETAVVGAFTMRNIRRDSFRLVFSFPEEDPIEAIACEYFDQRRNDWATVHAQWDAAAQAVRTWRTNEQRIALGLVAPDSPARIKVPGIRGENHARRFAAFHLADLIFRPHRAKFNTELSGLLPAYGSLCSMQHDVGNFGQGGECVDWDADTLTVETTEPLDWTVGANHYMRLIRPTGVATSPILVTPGEDAYHAVLATSPGFVPITADPDRVRTPYVFGPAANLEALVKPRIIKPRAERDIEIEAVLEDDRVHTADLEWLVDDVFDVEGGGPPPPDLGGGHAVFLTSRALHEQTHESEGLTPATAIELRNDGTLRTYRRKYSGIGTLAGEVTANVTTEWLQPNPVTTTISGGFAVRFTLLAVDVASGYELTGAAFDAWLALSTTRVVEFRSAAGPTQTAQIRVEIRDVATETIQITRTVYLSTGVTPSGGGA